jgi:glycosyltransferase involved in cell wall biosynthesis
MEPEASDREPAAMHIVLVSHYAPPHLGGIGFVATRLMERLSSRGHRVTMVTSDTGACAGTVRHGREAHIAVRSTNALENYDIPFPLLDPIELRSALRALLPSADIVHAHGMLFMSTIAATAMASRRGVPLVLTEHVGKIPYPSVWMNGVQRVAIETLGRYCCRKSSAVTVLNDRVGREVRQFLPRTTELVKIANGVDTDLFRPAGTGERRALRRKWALEKPTVLFVGRFARRKGTDLLLGAADGAFELVFCGANGAASVNGRQARVIPPLSQDELSELYRASDVLVLPSVGEGFPLVVQEAMASGLPVLVTDSEEYREHLDESVAVFSPREPRALRERILGLLRTPHRRRRMARAARSWALANFDWERTVDRYLALYEKYRRNRG